MHKTLLVAWREFKATALTKAFILAAVFVPMLLIALGALGPLLFNPTPPPLRGSVMIIDPSGQFLKAARIEFAQENIEKRINKAARDKNAQPSGLTDPAGGLDQGMRNPRSMSAVTQMFDIQLTLESRVDSSETAEIKAQLARGELLAFISTERRSDLQTATAPDTNTDQAQIPLRLYVPSNMNIKHVGLLEDLTQASAARAQIEAAGLNATAIRALVRAPEPATIRMSPDGNERKEETGDKVAKVLTPMAFMFLIWIGAFAVSGQYLLTTTIEEKSNKVMEVLLSAVSPMQLMTGKIIGQALVGMVMVGVYIGLAGAGLTALAMADLVQWADLAYFAVFYVMAYFMIAAMMAAIGSAVNELREAQSLMAPAMILLMVPMMLGLPISDSPNGSLATITSFIPPLTPFVMILRVTGTEPIAQWQIVLSIVWGFGAMAGMIWLAAKIFRVGVLMYGKPPSPLELIRWARYR